MRTRFTRSLLGLSLVAAALLAASACSDQAEGERCSTENGDTDCDTGLVCKQLSALGVTGLNGTAGVCCPENGPATTNACTSQGSALPGDGGPNGRADTGTSAGGSSSQTDTGTSTGGSSGQTDAKTPPASDASPVGTAVRDASLTVDAAPPAHD